MLQCTGTDDDDPSTFHSSPKLFHDVISSSQCVTKKHPERWLSALDRAGAERRQVPLSLLLCRQAHPGSHTTLVFALGCVHSSGTSSIVGGESLFWSGTQTFRIAFGHTSSLFLASPRLSPRQAQDVLGAGVGRLTSWNWLPPALRSIFSFGGVYWYPVS